MKDDDHDHAMEVLRSAVMPDAGGVEPSVALHTLQLHFHLVPRRVMAQTPPSLLRERAHFLEKDDLPWMAEWFRNLADATED